MEAGKVEWETRKQIWRALSELYLDTELRDMDYRSIVETLKNSGKSMEELKEIDMYEVFPTLQMNLNGIAGEWTGFDEKWLYKVCTKNYLKRNNKWFRLLTRLRNSTCFWMRKREWQKVETLFNSTDV